MSSESAGGVIRCYRTFVPPEAHGIAACYRHVAEAASQVAGVLRGAGSDLDAVWEGRSKTRFDGEFELLPPETQSLGEQLRAAADRVLSMEVTEVYYMTASGQLID